MLYERMECVAEFDAWMVDLELRLGWLISVMRMYDSRGGGSCFALSFSETVA